jgi:hypothetical protein
MTDEDEIQNEQSENELSETENRSFSFEKLNRIGAILFVLGIYLIIFLKILVLE